MDSEVTKKVEELAARLSEALRQSFNSPIASWDSKEISRLNSLLEEIRSTCECSKTALRATQDLRARLFTKVKQDGSGKVRVE